MLLHGFTNTGAAWRPVLEHVGERYRALAPDIRGHGAAAEREPVTLDAVIADIAALAPPTFVLCGYSMGGRIALHAALALPERVRALVTIGASPGIADPGQRAARRAADEALAARIERMTIEEFAAEWARTPVLGGVSADIAAAAHADRLSSTPAGLARALTGLGTGALPSLWQRLPELTMPALFLAGERDAKFAAIAREMAASAPGARAQIVPGAGHAAHLEAPAAVAAAIGALPQEAAGG